MAMALYDGGRRLILFWRRQQAATKRMQQKRNVLDGPAAELRSARVEGITRSPKLARDRTTLSYHVRPKALLAHEA
jgi:hypothetical protein